MRYILQGQLSARGNELVYRLDHTNTWIDICINRECMGPISPSCYGNFIKNIVLKVHPVVTYHLFPLCLSDCQASLGMQSKEIKDTQISASTTYNLHKPHYGRINLASFGGDPARTSWCATKDDKDPYLEIDLPELTSFTGVATQVNIFVGILGNSYAF